MIRITFVVLAITLFIQGTLSCRGAPNPNPIIESQFTKVESHQFGEKYHYYSPEANQNYYLLRLWGSSYQAGVAYGTLLKNQLKTNIKNVWKYLQDNIEDQFKFVTKLPPKLQPIARTAALKLFQNLLLANHYYVRPFTPKRYLDEYAGISVGSGIPQRELVELNMIPEIVKAGCSILGVWGKATTNGDLIHLRALDWDINNPMHKFPTLVIYNLNEKGSHPFMNVAWAGFIGSLTGFGEFTGVGQQVRIQHPSNKNQTRFGKPWTYALRDVIQFSQTIDQALDNLNKTRRTCSIHVGISNAKNNTFRLIKYSQKEFDVFDDKNFPFTATHKQMDDVVSMPIHDDKGDSCFNDLLDGEYGKINSDWIVQFLAASHRTGDTQMAAYNFNKKELLLQVSNQTLRAYERPTIRIPLTSFFKFAEHEA